MRIPYKIDETISWFLFMIALFLCSISIYQTFRTIFCIMGLPSKPPRLLYKLIEFFYVKPLQELCKKLLEYPMILSLTHYNTKILEAEVRTKNRVRLLTITFLILPQMLLAIALLLDVILLNKIVTFYKVLFIN